MIKKEFLFYILVISLLFIPLNPSSSIQDEDASSIVLLPDAITASESWMFNATGAIYTSPAFIDVDSDRYLEVVFGSYDDYIYCIDCNGDEVWKYPTLGDVYASPAIADMNNDNSMDIVIASKDGGVYCLNANGSLLWMTNTTVSITNSPVVADIDIDGNLEILISDSSNTTFCLNNLGTIVWNYTSTIYSGSEPIVGNINGTPQLEIIMLAPLGVITLNYQGNLINYDTTYTPNQANGLTLADLNNTGVKQLLFYENPDTLICANVLDLTELYFSYADISKTTYCSTPVVVDIDFDDHLEIFVIATKPGMSIFGGQGSLYNFESNGTLNWVENFAMYSYYQPLLSDIDANDSIDIITACPDVDYRYIDCYDELSNDVFSLIVSGQITNSPLVMDIDYDDKVEILYPSINGGLYCLELAGITNSGKTYWSRDKGSSFNTNCADRDGDFLDDLTEDYLGTNPTLYDTDTDLLSDWEEVYCYQCSPILADTDNDGLDDFEEVTLGVDGFITNPSNNDTDSDGYSDFEEYLAGTDPTDPNDPLITSPTPTPTNIGSLNIIIVPCSIISLYTIGSYIKRRKALK